MFDGRDAYADADFESGGDEAEARFSLTALGDLALEERCGERFVGFGPCRSFGSAIRRPTTERTEAETELRSH